MERMIYNRKFTPERIVSLAENEIFVFGSNLAGAHGGGAARIAYDKFGAVWGMVLVFKDRVMPYLLCKVVWKR